jgi:LuxR family maltose regulon positive regulatory protein
MLEEASSLGDEGASTSLLALGLQSLVDLETQRLDEARVGIREGVALMDLMQLHGYTSSWALFAACACLDLERADPDAARTCLERAAALLPTAAVVPWWSILLAILCGRVALGLGDIPRAEILLGQARRELTRFPDSGVLPHWLLKEDRALEAARGGAAVLREPLTDAELRVLELAPTHLTLEEIGRSLCISRNTVKTHLKVIYSKLNVASRGEAVDRAQAVGLIGRHATRY